MRWLVVLALTLSSRGVRGMSESKPDDDYDDKFGGNLIAELRNDANLDLSVDEEYEDLRAELLAYHTALAKLASTASRRTMRYNPCWQIGGVCINYKLCSGFRFLTEVKGCRDDLNVCCFTWNRYNVKDMTELGFRGVQYPWSQSRQLPVGNAFPVKDTSKKKKRNKNEKLKSNNVDVKSDEGLIKLAATKYKARPTIGKERKQFNVLCFRLLANRL